MVNGFKLSWSSISYDFACPLRALFSSFILGTGTLVICSSPLGTGGGFLVGFGGLCAFCILRGLSDLGFGIGLYASRNCSGG